MAPAADAFTQRGIAGWLEWAEDCSAFFGSLLGVMR